jgi:hypothetical protein
VRGMFNYVDVQSLELGDAKLLRRGSALMAKKGIAQFSANEAPTCCKCKGIFHAGELGNMRSLELVMSIGADSASGSEVLAIFSGLLPEEHARSNTPDPTKYPIVLYRILLP